MDKVKILIFDEEELTQTIIENYLNDVVFPFEYEKYNELDEGIIANSTDNNIIIVNINRFNDDLLEKITNSAKFKNNNFLIISYDDSTDLRVKALRTGAKDFLLKPLIKTDFLYSLQQIYRKFIAKQDEKSSDISIICSNLSEDENIVFMFNLANEVQKCTSNSTLIIDFPCSETNLSEFMNPSVKLQDINNINLQQIKKFKDSRLYILSLSSKDITKENIENMYKQLNENYKHILVNISPNMPYNLKTLLIDNNPDIYYILSMKNGTYDRIKKDLDILKNKKIKLITDICEGKNIVKLEQIQTAAGSEVFFKIKKNIIAFQTSFNLKKTYNEINPNYKISKDYVELAKKITNRI